MLRTMLVALVMAAVALVPAGRAAAAPHVVVWSGGLAPGARAVGVELRANGSGRRLVTDAKGHIHVKGTFRPRAARLRAIRGAAERLLAHGPNVTHAGNVLGGSYVTATLEEGSRRRLVTDTNADSPAVHALLARLDVVLPRASRLRGAGIAGTAAAGVHAAAGAAPAFPSTAQCPPGSTTFGVQHNLSLQEAVADGIVSDLESKGVAGGDSVGFTADAHGKEGDLAGGSISILMPVEVSTNIPGADLEQIVNEAQAGMDGRNQHYTIGGIPVTVGVGVFARRPGAPPTPCVNQLLVTNDTPSASTGIPNGAVQVPQPFNRTMPSSAVIPRGDLPGAKHLLGDMLGFPDGTTPVFHFTDGSGRADIPLPQDAADGADLQQFLPPGVDASDGVVDLVNSPTTSAQDIMGANDPRGSDFTAAEIASLLGLAQLRIQADPGVLLVSKGIGFQSFVIGAPLDVTVPNGTSVHQDGIVAYCTDLTDRLTPTPGSTFDVLPSAGALGGEAMTALQRVAEIVAAREPGPLEETPGASNAIWRVTNDAPVDRDADPAAASILDAAGVPLDPAQQTFAAPHFVDPAAAIPQSVALASPTSAAPLTPAPLTPPKGFVAHGSKLLALAVAPRRLTLGRDRRPLFVVAHVRLGGLRDRASVVLTRTRRHRTVTVARTRTAALPVGDTPLVLVAHGLGPGSYGLSVRSAHGGTLHATISVRRKRRR